MGNTYYNTTAISTATTTLVKTGAGILGNFVVTGGVAGTVKVYDGINATGILIVDLGSTNALATYILDRAFRVGLCIVTSSATTVSVGWK